ncbi:MAG: flavin reductase family protein [Bacteroidia bacterium]|nr:flavin reductase family protein [Bacteroidia bacterium]
MSDAKYNNLIPLDTKEPIWNHFYTVAPLVVIGSKEGSEYDLAPKHMVTPLGYDNYFGFVCTPDHATYHNVKRNKEFTVSFIKPDQVIMASLAAAPRCVEKSTEKAIVKHLPQFQAHHVDAPFVKDSYLLFECRLDKIVDGFGDCSMIAGKIIAAYVDPGAKRISDGDEESMIYDMPMLAYLPYGRFAKIQKTFAFPFPKDFAVKNLIDQNS